MPRPNRNLLTKLTELCFQNVSPPWVFKAHIRNLNECAAEKSTKISEESFVQLP
jgi:hypothetical protein